MTGISDSIPATTPQAHSDALDNDARATIDLYMSQADKSPSHTAGSHVLSDFLKKVESGGRPSLDDPANLSTEQLMILVTSLMNKLNLLMTKSSEATIKMKQSKEEDASVERNLQVKKQREQAKKAKKSGLLGKIFGWLATAIALVAATLVAVISFGAGSVLIGVVAVAGAAMAITMSVLTETKAMEKMMKPMIASLTSSFISMGLSPKKAKLAASIMGQAIVAAVVITAQIAMTVLTLGSNTGSMVGSMVTRFTSLSAKVAKYASKAVSGTITVANIAAAAGTAGAGAANITAGVYQKKSMDAQAQTIEMKAMLDHLQQEMDRIRDFITMLIKMISQNSDKVNDVLDLQAKARETVISGQKNFA